MRKQKGGSRIDGVKSSPALCDNGLAGKGRALQWLGNMVHCRVHVSFLPRSTRMPTELL